MNVQFLGFLSNVLTEVKFLIGLNILLSQYCSDVLYFNIFCVADISGFKFLTNVIL